MGFEYKYINIYDSFSSLSIVFENYIVYAPILIALFIIVFLIVYYFGPIYFLYLKYRKDMKNKLKKRQFIERIKLQREIEDEVEKELK